MAVRSERDKSSFDVSQFAPKNSDRQLRKMHLRCPPLKYLQSQRTHFEFAIHQCCSLLRYLRLSAKGHRSGRLRPSISGDLVGRAVGAAGEAVERTPAATGRSRP